MKSLTECKMLSLKKKNSISSAEHQLFKMWDNFLHFFQFQDQSSQQPAKNKILSSCS